MTILEKIATVLMIIFLDSCEKINSKTEKSFVEIPERIVVLADARLSERQGVLYFAQKPFSGFIIENYSHGKLAFKNGYLNGKLEGKQEKWYPDGSKMEIRFYHDNRKVGKHTGWWENQRMKFEYFIENDISVKTHREWYPNGQLFSLSNYNNEGQPEGEQKMWFDTGQIKANYLIKNGRRFGFLGAKGCMGENEKKQTDLNFKK